MVWFFELVLLLLFPVAGYVLQVPLLVGITIVCVVIGTYLYKTLEELASLFTIYFIANAVIGNLLMWIVYLCTATTIHISPWLHAHVLR